MDFQSSEKVGEGEEEMNGIMGDIDEKKQKKLSSGKRGGSSGGGVGGGGCCQVEKCTVDLTEAKRYHRRHKVCEFHSKTSSVLVSGIRQRFCQQCSRFHELSEFDEAKRSCRRRLAGHNERRRKTLEPQGEGGSSSRTNPEPGNPQCRPSDHVTSSVQMTSYPASSPTYKNFQIR